MTIKPFRQYLAEDKHNFTSDEAKSLGDSLDVDWDSVDLKEFIKGLSVESEHDDGGKLDVVDSNKDLAKIVLAHLKEKPDYYTKLEKVEEEVPANSVSGGGIAGLREPIVFRKRRQTVAKR
jgi:Protein of unknown function (DUF5661)